jgi:ubiquinone/menaquinone biosynthesis C-methylase UbiE
MAGVLCAGPGARRSPASVSRLFATSGPRTGARGPKDPKRAWHHSRVTDQEARYDRIAEGYATWWSPVHRQATLRLLDDIAGDMDAGARRLLDVGCGTGALAAAAVTRWPDVEVDAIDASVGMLQVAERTRAGLPETARARLRLHHAHADHLGLGAGDTDVVVTAFVLQLVPSPFRALREIHRVLRPGGRLSCVTWLRAEIPFAADEVFDDALTALNLPGRAISAGGRDEPATPDDVVARLRRAGYADARARADVLVHQFTPEGFLEFLARFDEEDLFASLSPAERERLRTATLDRLRALPPEGLRLELPIAYATARRPPGR